MVASPEGVSLRFPLQPSVFLCLSSPHTAGQPAGSLRLRVCVCVFTPDCYGRMWWFSSKPECLRKIKWLPVRIFTFSVNVLKWSFFGKKHRKPSSLDSSSGSSVSSYVWPPATKTENDRKADKQIIHQRVLIIDCVSFHCENELLLFHHIITKTSCLTAD